MVVLKDKTEENEDTRRQRMLQNLRNYTLKLTIFNFAAACETLKTWLGKTFK
jgi:predicted kinase